MNLFLFIGIILTGYLIGSIPFGYLIVRIFTGKDIRNIHSGRTGGTNAMRAAGFWAGLTTAICDILKGASAVYFTRVIFPGDSWLHITTGLMTILGHNYSIFLIERKTNGRLHLRGGAGGGTTAGAAIALWPPIAIIFAPVAILLLFVLGYASVTTISIPLIAVVVFSVRTGLGLSPSAYIIYGVLAEAILLWALRPNIKRLINGTERLVGLRAKLSRPGSWTSLNKSKSISEISK